MNNSPKERVETLLQKARALPPEAQKTYLMQACGSDAPLRMDLEKTLLMEAKSPTPPLTPSVLEAEPVEHLLGTTVGSIRLVEILGEGGMGTVFLGHDETLKRKVAVKCIRAEHSLSDEMKARFLREARILSRLQHPNICQIHEYLVVEDDEFLVLEFIEGQTLKEAFASPLTDTLKMRIALQIADVLAASHAAGVVHRDLKPANVMLTPEGQVKILDFGIARSIDEEDFHLLLDNEGDVLEPTLSQDLGASDLKTLTGSVVGTPQYMSPEQALGEPSTSASDMFSFGLMLQEMFTGRPPYPPGLTIPQLLLAVFKGETEPIEGLEPALTALLERLKSIAPGARPSALDTADHLRAIRDAPTAKRRRTLQIAAVVALVLVTAFMTAQAFWIRQERDRANLEAETAEQTLEFLLSLFEVSDPGEARGNTITAREILDQGAQKISHQIDNARIRARLLDSIGSIYLQLGLLNDARPLLQDALTARREEFQADHPQIAESLDHLSLLKLADGAFQEADDFNLQALEMRRKAFGPGHLKVAESLSQRALIHATQGKFAEAEEFYSQVLEIREAALGRDHVDVAEALVDLAFLLDEQNHLEDAEKLHLRALAIHQEQLGDDHPKVALGLGGLGIVYDRLGRYAEARASYERALEISEKVLGPTHFQTATLQMNLATLLPRLGEHRAAEGLYLQARTSFEEALSEEHPRLGQVHGNLANLYAELGRFEEAAEAFQRAQTIFEASFGPTHPAVASCAAGIGRTHLGRRHFAEAEPYFRKALTLFEQTLGPGHPDDGGARYGLASVLIHTDRDTEAEQILQGAIASTREVLGEHHHRIALFQALAGDLERRRGHLDRASSLLAEAQTTLEASTGAEPKDRARVLHALANLHRDRGQPREAQALYKECGELLAKTYGEEHPTWVALLEDQAETLRQLGKASAATRAEAKAQELRETFDIEPRG